jgi:hypothetical protein
MPKLEISKVHDAYRAATAPRTTRVRVPLEGGTVAGECPLCLLAEWAEETYLRSFQHSRVMEPNVRVKTNDTGFCPLHYRKLYEGENKLGLGLMVHTHLREKLPLIQESLEAMRAGAAAGRKGAGRLEEAAASLENMHDTCFICDLLKLDLDRYAFTILYLWRKDAEFLSTFRSSRGFCLSHFLVMVAKGRRMMRADRLQRWLEDCIPLMMASLQELERDLLSFTQLHHDANRGLGSDGERTALARVLQKLAGGRFHLE